MLLLKKTILTFFIGCFLSTTTVAGDLHAAQDPLIKEQTADKASHLAESYTGLPRYYQVKSNDTIWSIASQYIPDDKSINEYQVIAAIYRNNIKAFGGGNLNNLHKVKLEIPPEAFIALEKEQSGRELVKKGKILLPELPQSAVIKARALSEISLDANKHNRKAESASLDKQAAELSKIENNKDLISNNTINNNELKNIPEDAALNQKKAENTNALALETLNQVIEPLSSKIDTKFTDLKNEIKNLNDSYNLNEKKAELAQKQLSDLENKYRGSVSSLTEDLTYVKDKINELEGENSLLKDQALYYKEQLSKLENKLQDKEQQSLNFNNLLQNILSISSIFLVLLCLLVLLKVLRANSRKEKVKLITYAQPIVKEPLKTENSSVKEDNINNAADSSDQKQMAAEEERRDAGEQGKGPIEANLKDKLNIQLNNNKLDNNLSNNASSDAHDQDSKNNCSLDSKSGDLSKSVKSLRKRNRPYIPKHDQTEKNSVKAEAALSNTDISAEKNESLKKKSDAEKKELVRSLYQNDDDFEDLDYEEYDSDYQKYKDKLDLASVYIDTGDIEEALDLLLEIKEQADPYLANKAEILIKKYADH